MTFCCETFKDWTNSNDEYIWYDTSIEKWRGDAYMPKDEFIFEYCPFCREKL
jgi:hypothetical protein